MNTTSLKRLSKHQVEQISTMNFATKFCHIFVTIKNFIDIQVFSPRPTHGGRIIVTKIENIYALEICVCPM